MPLEKVIQDCFKEESKLWHCC